MTGAPFLAELLRRLGRGGVVVGSADEAPGATSVEWLPSGHDRPVTLLVSEDDVAAAVRSLGAGYAAPGEDVEGAGFDLLLVHVTEVLATRDTSAALVVDREGLRWPEQRLPSDLPGAPTGTGDGWAWHAHRGTDGEG